MGSHVQDWSAPIADRADVGSSSAARQPCASAGELVRWSLRRVA